MTLLEGTLELYERDPGGADQFEKVAAVAAHPRCPVARAEVPGSEGLPARGPDVAMSGSAELERTCKRNSLKKYYPFQFVSIIIQI